MGFEEDYIMRTIKNMTKAIAKILLGKSVDEIKEMETETKGKEYESDREKIFAFVKNGSINEAENLLYDCMKEEDKGYVELGLSFYLKVNEFSDEYLIEHGYSREEIKEGLDYICKRYGISGLVDNLL